MAINQVLAIFITIVLYLLLSSSPSHASEADVNCLKTIKSQLKDPNGYLSSWEFGNNTAVYICKFTGVTCWHDDENRVLSIKLPDFGLQGEFPLAIKQCSSLTGLDLSRNSLSGALPSDISTYIGNVTTLDLSFNKFSGQIPSTLANCSYLNALVLNDNQFMGEIPSQLASLGRLKQFSVANNQLTGQVPNFGNQTVATYDNNPGLCGGRFVACGRRSEGIPQVSIIGGIVGAVIFAPVGAKIGCLCFNRKEKHRGIRISPLGNNRTQRA